MSVSEVVNTLSHVFQVLQFDKFHPGGRRLLPLLTLAFVYFTTLRFTLYVVFNGVDWRRTLPWGDVFYFAGGPDTRLVFNFMGMVIGLHLSYIYSVILRFNWTMSDWLLLFEQGYKEIEETEDLLGSLPNSKPILARTRLLKFLGTFIFINFYSVGFFSFLIAPLFNMELFELKWQFAWVYGWGFLMAFIYLLACYTFAWCPLLHFLLCTILCERYEQNYQQFKTAMMLRKEENVVKALLTNCQTITFMVVQADRFIQHYMGNLFALWIPLACFAMFSSFNFDNAMGYMMIFAALGFTANLLIPAYLAAKVSNRSGLVSHLLHGYLLDNPDISKDVRYQGSLILQRIHSATTGLTVHGIFVINSNVTITVITALITYYSLIKGMGKGGQKSLGLGSNATALVCP